MKPRFQKVTTHFGQVAYVRLYIDKTSSLNFKDLNFFRWLSK